MPKPGYYYYENRRALHGMLFLSILAIGIVIERRRVQLNMTVWELFLAYRVPVIIGILAFGLVLYFVLRIRFGGMEPRPMHYNSRDEFILALARYCRRKGYKPGWVYYRSEELWPELE